VHVLRRIFYDLYFGLTPPSRTLPLAMTAIRELSPQDEIPIVKP
jgi:hypothetical protein